MFVGYIYSFVAALLLSLVCAGYAASGVICKLKNELKKESSEIIVTEKNNNPYVFIAEYDRIETDNICCKPTCLPDTIPRFFEKTDIPIPKIPKSNFFLRPPPHCDFISKIFRHNDTRIIRIISDFYS